MPRLEAYFMSSQKGQEPQPQKAKKLQPETATEGDSTKLTRERAAPRSSHEAKPIYFPPTIKRIHRHESRLSADVMASWIVYGRGWYSSGMNCRCSALNE